jgi:signal transduction histidine kinase
MKNKLIHKFLSTPSFIISFFFPIVLYLSIINKLISVPTVYLPLLILPLYILTVVYVLPKYIKNYPLLSQLDEVELVFYLWALFVFKEPLLIIFPMVHLILDDKIQYPKYQIGKLSALYALAASSGAFRYYFHQAEVEQIVSQTLMILFFLTMALLINRFIKKIKTNDLQKIKELNHQIRSKNLLLSTMSHELRTPLTIIQTAASLLIEERPGKINEMQRTFLNTIDRNTTRLIDLTESILTRIKIETTWLKLNTEKIDIRTVIHDVINQFDPIIQQEDKSIDFTHPKLLPSINGDYNWLSQVMINLIHNAKKNIDSSGKIYVHVKENEQFIVVSVSDNGAGVDDKNKAAVYDEFYSEDKKSGGTVEGIGLGLSIVKFVIEKHDGKVYMGSIAGLGTTFSFTLPKMRSRQ